LALRGSTIKSHELPREYRTICKEKERTSHQLLKEKQTDATLAVMENRTDETQIVVVNLPMIATEIDVVVHADRLMIPTGDEKGENLRKR
jgi:hypothetical protein